MLRKNVLLIIADEFRADCLGAAGNPVIQTPHLDAFARESVRFDQCYVQTSPCGPSRMCIYTGRYLCAHNSSDNMTPLMAAEDNLAMHLRRHGLDPAIMGYNDYAIDPRILPEGHPHKTSLCYDYFLPGFEVALDHEYDSPEWYAALKRKGYPPEMCRREVMYAPNVPPEGPGDHNPFVYPAHYRAEDSESQFMTDVAVDYCARHRGEGWFLSVNYIKPHGPYICPAPYHAMYDPAAMPPPVRRPEELTRPHPYFARLLLNAPGELMQERDWRELRACYYGMISELDACLGRLFRAIKESGQWDNTLIIFTSDHGSYMGDHYLVGKAHFYDTALRVPYILRDPDPAADATRGSVISDFCECIDTAPTVCEFFGLPPHDRFQGRSLLGAARGLGDTPPRPRIHHEYYYYSSLKPEERSVADPDACRLWTVRDRRFKYVQFGEEALPPLLFDLQADPGEFENLAARPEYALKVAEYCQHLLRWRMRVEDTRMERWANRYRA